MGRGLATAANELTGTCAAAVRAVPGGAMSTAAANGIPGRAECRVWAACGSRPSVQSEASSQRHRWAAEVKLPDAPTRPAAGRQGPQWPAPPGAAMCDCFHAVLPTWPGAPGSGAPLPACSPLPSGWWGGCPGSGAPGAVSPCLGFPVVPAFSLPHLAAYLSTPSCPRASDPDSASPRCPSRLPAPWDGGGWAGGRT